MSSIREIYLQGISILKENNITSANIDARILLSYVLDLTYEQMLLNFDQEIKVLDKEKFFSLIDRRAKKEPISHIINCREFLGRKFYVNKDVLDPRPDTECIIEACFELFPKESNINILDIGTGSGCLIICLKEFFLDSTATATDISNDALIVAKKNSKDLNIKFIKSNFAENISGKFDLIVSNPPYIPTNDIKNLEDDVKIYEPRLALDGGIDGLDPYRKILPFAEKLLNPNGFIVFEFGVGQEKEISKIYLKYNFKIYKEIQDLTGRIRGIIFQKF